MGRAPCCEKMGLKKGPWTPEEDRILIDYVQHHGHDNWRKLPKLAGLLRCGKSCRLRWTNYLRPDIKRGNFSSEEEDTIIKLHEMLGNRWSAIAARLPGRTDNEIKNVWHTHLKKRVKQNKEMEAAAASSIDDAPGNKVTLMHSIQHFPHKKKSKAEHRQADEDDKKTAQLIPSVSADQPDQSSSTSITSIVTSTEDNFHAWAKEELRHSDAMADLMDESLWSEVLSDVNNSAMTDTFPAGISDEFPWSSSPSSKAETRVADDDDDGGRTTTTTTVDCFWYNVFTGAADELLSDNLLNDAD